MYTQHRTHYTLATLREQLISTVHAAIIGAYNYYYYYYYYYYY